MNNERMRIIINKSFADYGMEPGSSIIEYSWRRGIISSYQMDQNSDTVSSREEQSLSLIRYQWPS
jgi:hypothetical protein